MSQLFSHVASKFAHSTEDLATEALCYILQADEALLEAFIMHVNEVSGASLGTDMRLETQKTTADGGRPDLVGWERGSSRRLFVESKFGAGLSGKQPTGYLNDLQGDSGSVLLFLVPDRRKSPIWRDVTSRCSEEGYLPETGESSFCTHLDSDQHLSITTWSDVLDTLDQVVSGLSTAGIDEDIRQLRVLCEQEGGGAFRPFKADEFEPWIAERMIDLHGIVDDLKVDLAERSNGYKVTSKQVKLSNMNYRFFAKLHGDKAGIGVRYNWWSKHGLSPLWIRLYIKDRQTQHIAKEQLKWSKPVLEGGSFGPEHLLVPFEVPTGLGRQDVVNHLLRQLQTIATRLNPILTDDS